ncbi:acyltransferase, partial [bacterium]|nr:acyltransferase [bacterium]
MVITVLLASWLLPSPLGQPQETIKTAIGTMLLSANIVIERSIGNYFAPTAQDNPLLNTWSLSVEEQFYVLFPVLLA